MRKVSASQARGPQFRLAANSWQGLLEEKPEFHTASEMPTQLGWLLLFLSGALAFQRKSFEPLFKTPRLTDEAGAPTTRTMP